MADEPYDRCENCDWPIDEGMGHVHVVNGFERFYCNPEPTQTPHPRLNAAPTRHVMTYEEGFIRKQVTKGAAVLDGLDPIVRKQMAHRTNGADRG